MTELEQTWEISLINIYGNLLKTTGREHPFRLIRRTRVPQKHGIEDDTKEYSLYHMVRKDKYDYSMPPDAVCYREVSLEDIPDGWEVSGVITPIIGKLNVIGVGKKLVEGCRDIDTRKLKFEWLKAQL